MRTKRLPAVSLILDYGLYPRHEMDSSVVGDMVHALQAGETLPPVIIDKKTSKIADGFHRTTACLRAFGDDADIEVEPREYADEAAFFLDAVRLNARHGYRLTKFDQARCLQLAAKLEIDQDAIAGALALPVDLAAHLKATKTAYDSNGEALPLKRTIRHLSGQRLTEPQAEFNRHASGWSIRFHAQQLTEAITSKSVDWTDQPTIAALQRLADVLSKEMALLGTEEAQSQKAS